MSSLMRMLSIGKEKKQPPPVRDIEAIKQSISGPRALAPRHIIDERVEAQKAKRIADREQPRKVSTSPSLAQPSPASVQRPRKTSQATLKKQVKVVFAERPKALSATPTASTQAFGNPDTVTQKRENFITVTLNRKSAASSLWCCAGPDEQDSSDQLASQSNNNVITEVVKNGPVLFFRNEEERGRACRIIATLRESLYDNEPAEPSVLRCGRDCARCLSQMASRHDSSGAVNNRGTEDPIPSVVIRVIEDPEDAAAEDQGDKRMNDADIEVFVINAFESSLHGWTPSRDL